MIDLARDCCEFFSGSLGEGVDALAKFGESDIAALLARCPSQRAADPAGLRSPQEQHLNFGPRWRARFPAQTAGLSEDDLHLAVNAVEPAPIRVDADEVTYPCHVILRYRLDDLLDGTAVEPWLQLARPFVPRAVPAIAHMGRGARLRLARLALTLKTRTR